MVALLLQEACSKHAMIFGAAWQGEAPLAEHLLTTCRTVAKPPSNTR